MPPLRSATSTQGRRMAAARSLWRATGMTDADFGRPIVAIANSFTEFVPGHVHLDECGAIVAEAVREAGGVPRQFHTIAVDDGIAMGHAGMLYSLPSRELIADSIEYMVNAHCADALVCLSNCDKITPGMLIAAMRLNIPTIFVSGGPMEAGRAVVAGESRKVDLIHAMRFSVDDHVSDDEVAALERAACPTCGSCAGMFSANSMNCLAEALGLALPGNGSLLASHARRRTLFEESGRQIVALARRHYDEDDERVLPRAIAGRASFLNAFAVDLAMGGSSNSVLHLLAAARTAGVDLTLEDVDLLSRQVPHLCRLAPASDEHHIEDFHRAGGIFALLGELERMGLIDGTVGTVHADSLAQAIRRWDIAGTPDAAAPQLYRAAPGGRRTTRGMSQSTWHESLDLDRAAGCLRDRAHAWRADGGLAVLRGNLAPEGAVVKTAAIPDGMERFSGPARIFESEEEATEAILKRQVKAGDVLVVRFEGPKGGPGMQEMLYPTTYLKAVALDARCALITDGRFSGGSAGLSVGHIAPEAAAGGPIGLIESGDLIRIDIPARRLDLVCDEAELARRCQDRLAREGRTWRPATRQRTVSEALRLYAASVASAARGAVRDVSRLD